MSYTKNEVELCASVVHEVYGELSSRIFHELLRRGRLTVVMLMQRTTLPPEHIRSGLTALIQQKLVFYSSEEDSGNTFYEANIKGAYFLMRAGKVLDLVNSRYGGVAKEMMDIILQLGHASVADISKEYEHRMREREQAALLARQEAEAQEEFQEDANGTANGHASNGMNGHGVNGTSKHELRSSNALHVALWDLWENGLLEVVRPSMFRSPADTKSLVEKEILQRDYGGSLKGTKVKIEFNASLKERLQEIRAEGREPPVRPKQRIANGDYANGGKRRRTANGHSASNGDVDEDVERLDSNQNFRINEEKCTVGLRSQILVKQAHHDIGPITASIYAVFLRLLERHISRCRLDPEIDDLESDSADVTSSITVMSLEQELDQSIPIHMGIGKMSDDKIDTRALEKPQRGHKRKMDEDIADSEDEDTDDQDDVNSNGDIPEIDRDENDEEGDSLFVTKSSRPSKVTFKEAKLAPEDRQSRLFQVSKHLQLLAEHRFKFVRRCGNDGRGEYTVDFDALIKHILKAELDTIYHQEFGKYGLRLLQILREKGKLDEKTLNNLALIKQKDLRTKMVEMHRVGMVDIQEVPRDNSRAINRMIFLWYFDEARVNTIVLDRLYKSMTRALQVLDCEKLQENETLAQAERTDVRGHEEAYLSKEAYTRLLIIRAKEEKIMAQIGRLDDLVGVFRDF